MDFILFCSDSYQKYPTKAHVFFEIIKIGQSFVFIN